MTKTICILIMLQSIILYSQENKKFFDKEALTYSIAYFGNNIANPGLKFETNSPIIIKTKEIQKKKKLRIHKHRLNWDGSLGFYWDPMSHVGVFTNYGVNYEEIFTKGFKYQIGLNPVGYLRTFLPETYEVDENWNVKKVFLPGRSYYAPSFSIGIGKLRHDKRLSEWFINLNSILLLPYNTGFVPLVNLEFGYKFKFLTNEK